MQHKLSIASLAIAALAAPTALAQNFPCGYEQNIGTPLGLSDDSIAAGLALGFNFTFPDGTVTNMIDVDSNGRVLLPGADTSDFSESLSEFLAEASSICPFWDDLNPNGTNADDVYFNALPGKAVVTWHDIVVYSGQDPFTFQCTLWADGRIWFVYDDRTPADEPLVGVSVGNGTPDPGPVDYTNRPFPTTTNTVYEDFVTFDLIDQAVEFIPVGSNWILTNAGCASWTVLGETCMPVFSMLFVPDGSGGYNLSKCTSGCWDPNYGTSLGLTDDSISAPMPLGFTFNFPGGVPTTDVEVDSNGRILVPGTDTSDLSPSLTELLGDPFSVLVPFWTDLNPSGGGDVLFNNAGGVATITWLGVPQFATATAHTLQVQLYPGDVFRFSYLNVSGFDPSADNLMIGASSGNGVADPGESDYTMMLPFGTSGAGVVYEYIDGTIPEYLDFQDAPFVLEALTRPVINTSFDLQVSNAPAAAVAAFYMIGFTNPNQYLGNLGLGLDGCILYSSGDVITLVPVTGGTAAYSLNIPNNPSLAGGSVYFQSPLVVPGANTIGLLFSNGIRADLDAN